MSVREAAVPFDALDANCATTLAALLPECAPLQEAVSAYRALPAAVRACVAASADVPTLASWFALEHGWHDVSPAHAPHGAIGYTTGAGGAHTLAARVGHRWYAKSTRGVARVPASIITRAWGP